MGFDLIGVICEICGGCLYLSSDDFPSKTAS